MRDNDKAIVTEKDRNELIKVYVPSVLYGQNMGTLTNLRNVHFDKGRIRSNSGSIERHQSGEKANAK